MSSKGKGRLGKPMFGNLKRLDPPTATPKLTKPQKADLNALKRIWEQEHALRNAEIPFNFQVGINPQEQTVVLQWGPKLGGMGIKPKTARWVAEKMLEYADLIEQGKIDEYLRQQQEANGNDGPGGPQDGVVSGQPDEEGSQAGAGSPEGDAGRSGEASLDHAGEEPPVQNVSDR